MSTHIVNKKLVSYELGHDTIMFVFEDKECLKFEAEIEQYETAPELVRAVPNDHELLLVGVITKEECDSRQAARKAAFNHERHQAALFQAWDLFNRYKDGIAKPLKLPDEVMDEMVNFNWGSTQAKMAQVTCRGITFYFPRPETT